MRETILKETLDEVTPMKMCSPSRVARYQGKFKPRCNHGLGCFACWSKWEAVHATRSGKRSKHRLHKAA